jgi:hypothetical protein
MLNWHKLFLQVGQTVNAVIRIAKSRRREEMALGLATIFFTVSLSFNKWFPEALRGWVYPWSGQVLFRVTLFVLGLIFLSYGIHRLWKLVFVPDLPPPANRPSAVKGPLAFTPSDGELFRKLGREDEVRKLLSYIQDDQIRLVVLMGASGAGKTSLLRAGLTDILKDTDINYHYWEAVPSDSANGLLTAIQQSWPQTLNPVDSARVSQGASGLESLDQLLNSAPELGRHVIVLDQFEQLSSAKNGPIFRFLRKVAREAKPPYRVTWLIAFRREFRANWSDFLIPEQERGFFPPEISLQLFTSEQARDVTSQLIQAAGLSVEQRVINNLIEAATVDGEVSSVDIGIGLLVLSELYERQGAKTLTQDIYHFAGGAEGLLTQYINRCLDSFPDDDRQTLLSAMLALREPETNQRVAKGKTSAELAVETEAPGVRRLETQLERLTQRDKRLLEHVGTNKDEAVRYRLPHERLIPALNRLAGTLIGELEEAKLRFDGAFSAWQSNKSSQYLLRGAALRLVDRNKGKIPWGSKKPEKLRFLRLSKRKRFIRTTLWTMLTLLITSLVGLGIWEARRQRSWQSDYPRELADYHHNLRTLKLDAFLNSTNVDFLDSNSLEELSLRVPISANAGDELAEGLSKCPRLKTLSLDFYGSSVQADLSLLPKSISELSVDLSNTRVPKLLVPNSLTKLTLNLRNSKLQTLPALSNTIMELTLKLNQSPIHELPPLPSSLTSLTLDLNNSDINALPQLPANLVSLSINLEHSNVRELPPLPAGLQIFSLYAPYNKLNAFPKLPDNLRELTIEGSQIPEAFPANLTELSLNPSYNKMAVLPPFPRNLIKLKLPIFQELNPPEFPNNLKELGLILIYNEMETLPPIPNSVTSLSLFLNYQGNQMEKVPALPNNLTNLYLNLSDSVVKVLPSFPKGLTELQLDLSNSRIDNLSDLPGGLSKLTIELNNSKLKELPQLPNSLKSLALNLQDSELELLPSFPDNLTSLLVNINRSSLTKLPPLPGRLTDITLNLINSKVKALPSFPATSCRSLRLELDDEQRQLLTEIPSGTIDLSF